MMIFHLIIQNLPQNLTVKFGLPAGSKGVDYCFPVGHVEMKKNELVENIMAGLKYFRDVAQESKADIATIHIKTTQGPSITIRTKL